MHLMSMTTPPCSIAIIICYRTNGRPGNTRYQYPGVPGTRRPSLLGGPCDDSSLNSVQTAVKTLPDEWIVVVDPRGGTWYQGTIRTE